MSTPAFLVDVGYGPQEAFGAYGYYPTTDALMNGDAINVSVMTISGFPVDVKDRELRNLTRFFPGFQKCELDRSGESVEGKVTFQSVYHAKSAIEFLDGFEFDDEVKLGASISSSGSEGDVVASTEEQAPSEGQTVENGRQQLPLQSSATPFPAPQGHPAGLVSFGPAGPFAFAAGPAVMAGGPAPAMYAPVKNEKDNPPCNTLFIGNLSDNVDEDEIRAVFGNQQGFQQLKVVRSPKGVSAFIEFSDTEAAAACHKSQQGLLLSTSDRGPIRVQFSKNPFGRKRDAYQSNGPITMAVHPGAVPAYGAYAVQVPPGAAVVPTAGFPRPQTAVYGAGTMFGQ